MLDGVIKTEITNAYLCSDAVSFNEVDRMAPGTRYGWYGYGGIPK